MSKMKWPVKYNAPILNNLCADLLLFMLPLTNVLSAEMTEVITKIPYSIFFFQQKFNNLFFNNSTASATKEGALQV